MRNSFISWTKRLDLRKASLKPRLEVFIAGVLLSGLFLLFVLTFLASRSFKMLKGTSDEAEHQRLSLIAIQNVNRALLVAESGQRGYLLTSKASYLDSYQEGVANARLGLAQVQQQLRDSPTQRAQVEQLTVVAQAKLAELQETVRLHASNHQSDALRIVKSDSGKQMMIDIQQIIGSLIADGRQQLNQRRMEAVGKQRSAERFFFVGEIAIAFIFGVAFLLIRRALIARSTVTEALQLSEIQLKKSEQMLRVVTDNLPVLIAYFESDGSVGFMNSTYAPWLGVDPVRAVGRQLRDALGEEAFRIRESSLRRAFEGHETSLQVAVTDASGLRHLQITYRPDIRPDGTVAGIFSVSTDITSMKAAEQHLGELARKDTLTGLANRRHFEEALGELLGRTRLEAGAHALLFLDIDHFKQINDSHGHAAGDLVLSQFASRLKASVRSSDLVARFAGDEFVVLLSGLNAPREAGRVAEKIVRGMEADFTIAGRTLKVTTSIGIAYGERAGTAEELLACADKALYSVKAAGRNDFRLLLCEPEIAIVRRAAAALEGSRGQHAQPALA